MRGVYTLILKLSKSKWLRIGRLGRFHFKKGYYVYTGSAMGKSSQSLGGRISRHISINKTLRWHIDYLIADEDIKIIGFITWKTDKKLECMINKKIRDECKGIVLVPNFGSKDCKAGCGSHLLYLGENLPIEIIKYQINLK